MKSQRINFVFGCLIFFSQSAAPQENFWEKIHTEKQYLAALDSCNEAVFAREFEHPFLVLLDDNAKKEYQKLSNFEKRKRYLKHYWDRNNANPLLAENEWLMKFLARCRFVKENFAYEKPPYFDDRGKYFLKLGAPSDRYVDSGGVKTVRLFSDRDNYREIAGLYNGFPPAKDFTVLPNETWSYRQIDLDIIVHFVAEGSFIEEVRSLDRAFNTKFSSRSRSWYWSELIKERRHVSAKLEYIAADIEEFEDRFKQAVAFSNFNRVPEIRTVPHRKIMGINIKQETEERVAKSHLPPAFHEPDKAISRLDFTSEISQFRNPNGLTKLVLAFFAPIEKNFVEKISNSPVDSLYIEYSSLLRDHLFNQHFEIQGQARLALKTAAAEGLGNVSDMLQLQAQPLAGEITLQVKDFLTGRIGFTKQPITVRDFRGTALMLSDVQLLAEIRKLNDRQFLPVVEMRDMALTPYPADRIRKNDALFCYFEIYNLLTSSVQGEIEITYKVLSEKKGGGLFDRLAGLFKSGEKSEISLSYSQPVTTDTSEELIALDVSRLEKGDYFLEISISAKNNRSLYAIVRKEIRIIGN